jgi:ABC-2 type transport system permease protein
MRAQLRAELLRQRSIRTSLALFVVLLVLVALAVLLHTFGLASRSLSTASDQLMVFGRGEFLGALFAALAGAMSITSEIRHGTIRPTFLASPVRARVVAAKVWVSVLIGAGLGLAASALAAAIGTAALGARGIDIRLDSGDYALLVAGGAAAGALFGPIGVGVGAIVRNQVPALIGICAWLLFVEGLIVGDATGVGDVGRFAPGALGMAASGQDPDSLVAPAVGVVLLVVYAAAAAVAGSLATTRRDIS